MDLISIIVPVYSVEKYLGECIDSILRQTYENFELILVDDGSPDDSGKICDKYAERDERIKVIHKENGGVSSARNTGLDNAKGEYITFVDSDDIIDNRYLELMYKRIVEADSDMCFCRFDRLEGNSFFKIKEGMFPPFCNCNNREQMASLLSRFFTLKNNLLGSSCRILYKAKKIKGNVFNEKLKIGEDLIYVIRCILKSETICSIKEELYHYRYNFGSATLSYRKRYLENNIALYNEVDDLRLPIEGNILDTYFSYMCYSLFLNEIKFKQKTKRKNINEIKKSPLYKYFKLKNIVKIGSLNAFLKNIIVWVIIKLHLY